MKRLNIRIDDDMHGMLTTLAEAEGVSVQQVVERFIADGVRASLTDEQTREKVRARLAEQAKAFGVTIASTEEAGEPNDDDGT